MKETLGEYIKRLTEQKGISLKELERRSNGRVSGSHLSKIIHGLSKNITVETIVGLALGLNVDAHEIFSVASGYSANKATESKAADPLVLADAVKKLATKPQLLEVIKEWVRMSDKEQKTMFDNIRFVNERGKNKGNKKH